MVGKVTNNGRNEQVKNKKNIPGLTAGDIEKFIANDNDTIKIYSAYLNLRQVERTPISEIFKALEKLLASEKLRIHESN